MKYGDRLDYRAQFGDLCEALGFTLAVEVGCHQGVFADHFLSRFTGKLICIDDYAIPGQFTPAFVPDSPSRAFDRRVAEIVLTGKHGTRAEFILKPSVQAAEEWDGDAPQFVYIDGSHELSAVMDDIDAWWPLLAPGGILAGHDYVSQDPTLCGVVAAVNYFVGTYRLDLKLTYDTPASWYVRKPE